MVEKKESLDFNLLPNNQAKTDPSKGRKTIRGNHAEIIKFSHVDRHHELYEEKVAWETENIHRAWFEDRRKKDVDDWGMQRIVFDQNMNTETVRRAAKIDHENKKMAVALKEASDQKERIKMEHKLMLEMQLLNKKQLEKIFSSEQEGQILTFLCIKNQYSIDKKI